MDFGINHAPVFASLTVQVQPLEVFKGESGAMVSMSPTLEIQSKKQG